MTIYVSDPRGSRWCILAELGGASGNAGMLWLLRASHVTACGARMDASEPYFVAGTVPDDELCTACQARRDGLIGGTSSE